MDPVGQEHHMCSKLQTDTTHSPRNRDRCILHTAHDEWNAAGCDGREQNLASVKVTGGAKTSEDKGVLGTGTLEDRGVLEQVVPKHQMTGEFWVPEHRRTGEFWKVWSPAEERGGNVNARRNKVRDYKRQLMVGSRREGTKDKVRPKE